MITRLCLAAVFLLVTACGDAETKGEAENVATNVNTGADAGTDSDAGSEPDAGGEPFGTTCPGPDGELGSQECSMVDQDCEAGTCEKRILLDDMRMPTGFAVICTSDVTEATLDEGDVCDPANDGCPANMVCKRFAGENESICRRWCRLADAYGCQPEQACVPSSDLEPVFGVCADACPG